MPQQTTDRLHALDAVRAFALLSGIALHATMPFLAGLKGWATTETPSDTLAGVWYVIHMFRMPVFFLIAGFFARMMLERRGLKGFIKDRSKRIVLPLVLGLPAVLVLTVIAYLLAALATGVDLQALRASAQQQRAASGAQPAINLGHLWFLYYLIIFYAGTLAARGTLRRLDPRGKILQALDRLVGFLMRGIWGPPLLALPMIACFYELKSWSSWTGLPAPFAIVPDGSALLAYGLIFGLGWLLNRQPALLLDLNRRWWLFGSLAVGLWIVCRTIAGPTPHWGPYLSGGALLTYTVAYMIGTWCWTFGLVGAAVRFLSQPSPARRYVADSSYWLYLMHIPALTFFDVLLHPLPWHWSVKYLLSIAGAVPVLLISYQYLVRYTFIGATLNGRRHPRLAPGSPPTPALG
jgi:peptidoglycan/LPS O-acetylase OafA/YrhL